VEPGAAWRRQMHVLVRTASLVGALLLLAACGSESAAPEPGPTVRAVGSGQTSAPAVTTTAGPQMGGTGLQSPPPFRLRFDDRELVLRPHTWCYENGCVDGVPPEPPPVGSPAEIRIYVPVEGWDLSAHFTPAGERCGRAQSVEPEEDAAGWYVLRPVGFAGSYDVELFARGRGDMIGVFRWQTPVDGPRAVPEATLALIADHDGEPDSYGVELSLTNLAETPRSAQALVTVTAGNGRTLTFEATRAEGRCRREGSVFFDGPDDQGRAAARLGGFPFRYEVDVTLDGRTYRATADYPADEIPGNEPSVALTFTPGLPALG